MGDPSDRTISSGPVTPTAAPIYAIKNPSGEHTGFSATPFVNRTGSPPSRGILNKPGPSLPVPPATIHVPSGDHPGELDISMSSAIGRRSPPSDESVYNLCFPCFRRITATCLPSRETPGGSNKGPSLPFHISVVCLPLSQ